MVLVNTGSPFQDRPFLVDALKVLRWFQVLPLDFWFNIGYLTPFNYLASHFTTT
ncbi:MAG: hypothetical protein QM610_14835 [Chitinophagaceae bacterium]